MALPIYSNTMRITTWRIQHSLVICLIFIASSVVRTQDPDFEIVPNSALCSEASTCSECMVIHPSCAWCMHPDFNKNDNYDRFDTMEILRLRCFFLCDLEIVPNTKSIIDDKPLSEKGTTENIVQVKPQKVTIKTRPGQAVPLPQLTIRQAEDFPVDLYYIMDLSQSMADDLNNLKDLGDKLAAVMGNITTNFKLGYGAFVDKLVMPYADILPSYLVNPCFGKYCDPPFGFKNVLGLTEETSKFADAIARVNASGNLDSPEGGLDALMQATVCKEKIGWRDHARHLLLYSTDAPFHIAGDGLLGGIVARNDGQCHVDNTNTYTMATELDYPSISQLSVQMKKHSILPIFAIGTADGVAIDSPGDPYRFYKDLPYFFHESYVTRLSSNSDDIVEVVKAVYLNITAGVKVEDNAPRDAFTLNYTAICLDGVPQTGVQECNGLQLGDDVFFNITLTMNKTVCASSKRKHTFNIGPTAFNEFMEVTVEAICECDCGEPQRGPQICNGTGEEICGGCQCDDGWSGSNCDCDKSDTGEVDMGCVWNVTGDNPIDDPIECNNRGVCNCGECNCNKAEPGKRYYGTHCQCDDFSCPRHDKQICGGPKRGVCMCNESTGINYCNCTEDYIGERCECPKSTDGCRSPDGTICNSGAGVCECGKCVCNDTSKYRGSTCFECKDCPGACEEHKPCVQCKAFNSGEYAGEPECDECPYNITIVEELSRRTGFQECIFRDDDDCLYVFTHERLPNGTYIIEVDDDKVCPDKSAILWMIIGIIVGILLVGLVLLLIWRLLTYIHDRREFNNFEKERENARWEAGENPIYKPSTSVFKNPTYGKN
ncbi:integrin beta-1-A-like [Amphiura filiformis]|uniref:integrin beta-1-A-like n=1 Tax=Amphiura filiformis TaxID=82378 RepID=UPI003B2156FB